jgi:hypothetical protein
LLILPEWHRSYIISAVNQPIVPQFYWTFSGQLLDFKLTPLVYLEEAIGPTIKLSINDIEFDVPTSWHIMIVDPDTRLVDTIPVAQCAQDDYRCLLINAQNSKYKDGKISVIDLDPSEKSLVYPKISKGTMMLHPVGLEDGDEENVLNVIIGPYDLYDKFLKNVSARELLY